MSRSVMGGAAIAGAAGVAALLAFPQARAHHTFVTKYDPAKLVTISGTVGSVSFVNPHIHFTVGGWSVETESISAAKSRGLTQAVLKEGAKATVTGWRARSGASAMGLKSISIAGSTFVMRSTAR